MTIRVECQLDHILNLPRKLVVYISGCLGAGQHKCEGVMEV